VKARYLDPRDDTIVEVVVADDAEIGDLIGVLVALESGRGHPALELEGSDGSSLAIGISGERAVLLWIDSLGDARHTVSGVSGDRLIFDYFGSYTEVPAEYCVRLDQAIEGVLSFVRAGVPAVDQIVFEPD
jgi:hypothetical protein